MSRASYARSGVGSSVSKAAVARGTIEKMIVKPAAQPSVSSNIPGAGPQGVPPADKADMGTMSREGKNIASQTVVAAQRGQIAYGPPVAGSVARMGGQVRVAPGQFGVWAHPMNILSDRS
jgi:hypothetical protein